MVMTRASSTNTNAAATNISEENKLSLPSKGESASLTYRSLRTNTLEWLCSRTPCPDSTENTNTADQNYGYTALPTGPTQVYLEQDVANGKKRHYADERDRIHAGHVIHVRVRCDDQREAHDEEGDNDPVVGIAPGAPFL